VKERRRNSPVCSRALLGLCFLFHAALKLVRHPNVCEKDVKFSFSFTVSNPVIKQAKKAYVGEVYIGEKEGRHAPIPAPDVFLLVWFPFFLSTTS